MATDHDKLKPDKKKKTESKLPIDFFFWGGGGGR